MEILLFSQGIYNTQRHISGGRFSLWKDDWKYVCVRCKVFAYKKWQNSFFWSLSFIHRIQMTLLTVSQVARSSGLVRWPILQFLRILLHLTHKWYAQDRYLRSVFNSDSSLPGNLRIHPLQRTLFHTFLFKRMMFCLTFKYSTPTSLLDLTA